jgi:hypothetical protein
MMAGIVLLAGVVVVLALGWVLLWQMGMTNLLTSVVPLAPMLVAIGTFLLILTEILLFLGNKEDRRTAVRDLSFLVPLFAVSMALTYITQRFLW